MNTALLSGEPSGSGDGSPRGRKPRLPAFRRRSDAIAHGTPYQKAAALVDLAEDGVGIPEQILDQSNYESAAKFYFMFIRFDLLWTTNLFALIILNFFEKPLWCFGNAAVSCSDREYYFLGQLPYLSNAQSLIYEGVTLIILVVHTFFPILYEGFGLFWRSHLHKLKVIFLLVLVADFTVDVLYLSPVALYSLPFRIAPYIRVIFFALNIRELRDSIVILVGMLTTYFNVLALGFLFLLFSSWVAYVMFEDTEQGRLVFTSFGVTLYQMFVLFTTSNNPDVWFPAYKASRWYSLFFVLYVLLGVYFVTSLILAVVYDSFKSQLAKQVAQKDHARNRILGKAFSLIDKYHVGSLNKEQCNQLFDELNKYRSLPKISTEDFEAIFNELDDSEDFKINVEEFTDLCHAIALHFQKEDIPPCFENYPMLYRSAASEKLKAFVRGPIFRYIVIGFLMLNLLAVVIETTLDIKNNSGQKFWQNLEFIFGWLYVLEMALKIYTYGFVNYWRDGQNRFDFILTWVIDAILTAVLFMYSVFFPFMFEKNGLYSWNLSEIRMNKWLGKSDAVTCFLVLAHTLSVIGETVTFLFPKGVAFLSNGEWIRYLLLARLLRLIRLLMRVNQYRALISTFLTLIPSLMPYLGTIFCVLCVYCSLGIQIFGGLVNAGNLKLAETDLTDDDYLLFNFNDYPNGMVTLFNLLVMNNWQDWMQSYMVLTGTAWSYAYFISFYLITVMLLLNLVVAFVLEAFFAEIEMEESQKAGGEGKDGRRDKNRYIASRSQRIDVLLHHILSSELQHTDDTEP